MTPFPFEGTGVALVTPFEKNGQTWSEPKLVVIKVPDTVEVSMRQKEGSNIHFLLNHHNSPIRMQFYKPMHDFLTGSNVVGSQEIQPHGVLVLDEHPDTKHME